MGGWRGGRIVGDRRLNGENGGERGGADGAIRMGGGLGVNDVGAEKEMKAVMRTESESASWRRRREKVTQTNPNG